MKLHFPLGLGFFLLGFVMGFLVVFFFFTPDVFVQSILIAFLYSMKAVCGCAV